MKKTVKSAMCMALVLMLVFCLTACGSAAGHYELTTVEAEGMSIDVAEMKEALGGGDMYLELNADGTGILKMDMLGTSEAMEMEWEDGYIWAVGEEDSKVPFSLDGKVLTMEQDGQKLVFTKD